jgi:hypothetical protein
VILQAAAIADAIGPLRLHDWMNTQREELDGLTPRLACLLGHADNVLDLARHDGEERP